MDEFIVFAGCEMREYELFCKAFDAEMRNTDGLAETELQSMMGLKLPVVIDRDDLTTFKHYGLRSFKLKEIIIK